MPDAKDAGRARMNGRWVSNPWPPEHLKEVNTKGVPDEGKHRVWSERAFTQPISALYIFASTKERIIRPGAIGVHRGFDQDAVEYHEGGNTVVKRFDQYNAEKTSDKLPWRARPWKYIWLVEFKRAASSKPGSDDMTIPELQVAEQLLHFHVAAAGFRFRGGACHDCPKTRHDDVKQVADAAVARFQELAPSLFAALPTAPTTRSSSSSAKSS